ncbi:hypothetical protein [Cohnella yongneupensis]|uniref:5-bromo-4-chloroindolyl phosphate hydrolysis protein n=1 Tax=Cohnella yongneupensis TaxID=425006 RepID=A0ABW0QXP0_9BACL
MNRIMKLLGLMVGVVLLDVIVLSPGLIGIRIGGGNVLETASSVTLVFMSVLVLFYGSYGLLLKAPVRATVRDIITPEDYIDALRRYKNVKAVKSDIALAIDQVDRMEKKKSALFDMLSQRFDPKELSYTRFSTVIHEVNHLFYLNIRGILNKLIVFDASEYDKFTGAPKPAQWSNALVKERTDLYQAYITYVSGSAMANEEILLKLDKLLLEISRLDSADFKSIEAMPGMKEIDALIQQTKFYKT